MFCLKQELFTQGRRGREPVFNLTWLNKSVILPHINSSLGGNIVDIDGSMFLSRCRLLSSLGISRLKKMGLIKYLETLMTTFLGFRSFENHHERYCCARMFVSVYQCYFKTMTNKGFNRFFSPENEFEVIWQNCS